MDLTKIKLLALDVDGTLTDGGVYFDDAGNETKRFHIQDGLGIVLAGTVGLQVAWITGRVSPIVERRARELGVRWLRQGVKDKAAVLLETGVGAGVAPHEIAYMGDDLNDLPALTAAAVRIAPANAVAEVRRIANVVTTARGGDGAVREAIEILLRARGDYEMALTVYLHALATPIGANPGQ